MKSIFKNLYKSFVKQERDPRYVFLLLGSAIVFVLSAAQVLDAGLFDSIERPIFAFFNTLPPSLYGFMYTVTQLGGLGSLIIWAATAWYLINKRAALSVAVTGIIAWSLAKVVKVTFHRGRPGDLLDGVQLFGGESLGGFGFPSGHAAVSAAIAALLFYQLPAKYRKYLILAVVGVGISRMYLGAHFPLDIVGGWAFGIMIGSSVALLAGMSNKGLSVVKVKSFLASHGYPARSVTLAPVDARGSRPMFMTMNDGTEYFAKYFGKQEHAADWLFKILRLFRYKNMQAEEPYINSRRNVEMEAFAMLWAKDHKIRSPRVIELVRYGSGWLLIQEKLDAKPLSAHGHLLQRSLEDAWRQVAKLHESHIAHRDLRAANIMIDKQGKAWIIDFGFAEVSPRPKRRYMDVAELLMSMTLVVGVDRTLNAACKVMSQDTMVKTLPYLQSAVFSGATTSGLKKDKELVNTLRQQIQERYQVTEPVEDADIVRISPRKVINLSLLAVFFYVIVPQFGDFKDAFTNITIQNTEWLIPLALSSLGTYVLTGLVYVALADVPLKLMQSSIVQLAASFISKFLPGGLASGAVNARYLVRAGMDKAAASSVLVTQGIISFIMFIVPLCIFLIINGGNFADIFKIKLNFTTVMIAGGVLLAALLIVAFIESYRAKVAHALIKFLDHLRVLAAPTRETAIASLASLGVTACYIMCLYAAFKAFGVELGVASAILVYASAVIARTAIPTPGGLGPLEVAMVAAMVGLGVDKPEALSVVILYRLATFWLPIPLSVWAYRYASKKKII